jgi:hypothetical protein
MVLIGPYQSKIYFFRKNHFFREFFQLNMQYHSQKVSAEGGDGTDMIMYFHFRPDFWLAGIFQIFLAQFNKKCIS